MPNSYTAAKITDKNVKLNTVFQLTILGNLFKSTGISYIPIPSTQIIKDKQQRKPMLIQH
jgi:hypothetical protein